MDLLEIAAMLVSLSIGLVVYHFRSARKAKFTDLLLEGATLSDLPSLKELLTNPAARDAIKAHVVTIGFDPGFGGGEGMMHDQAPEDVFLVDDGGGVHSLDTSDFDNLWTKTPKGRLESKAADLANLFGVEFRS